MINVHFHAEDEESLAVAQLPQVPPIGATVRYFPNEPSKSGPVRQGVVKDVVWNVIRTQEGAAAHVAAHVTLAFP